GIAAYERYPEPSVLDAGREAYAEAIRLTLDGGDVATAFALIERSRGARADELSTVRQRLEGSGAAIVELASLHDETIALLINANDAVAVRRVASVDRLLGELPLRGVKTVFIVADPQLDGVALAASRLVERVAVAFAPSASALRRERAARLRTIVAMAVASRDLPSTREELADLVRLYPQPLASGGTFASLVSGRADVIHICGHAEGGSDTTLSFRGERVSSRRIAASPLQGAPLVLLSACETLRAPRSPLRRTLSLGEGFLAAGARGVIGTLAPIPDNDAREIFGRIHRHLAAGRGAAAALRLAQLESMAVDRNGAWRSVALLTRTIDEDTEDS
ncbi:MAG: CHAT domain-containing protein, partial [Acidobacteriota bacterium]|nr:CHAT domain-containing protein [Acidobacteriota bacterium]